MNAMPRATDSQAVLAVVTWMNAYQLLPCALTIWCHTAGMTTPNRPQAIRPAGASVSSQPARMSTELHTRLRQVSGSAIREPNPEARHPSFPAGGSRGAGSRCGEPAPVGYVPPGPGLQTAYGPQGGSGERQAHAERDEGHHYQEDRPEHQAG